MAEETKGITVYDHFNNLTVEKKPADFDNDQFKKAYDQYLMNRIVSMTDLLIPVANGINQYNVLDSVHYNYYLNAIPKRKYYYNYIKKTKDLNKEQKKYIAHFFECGLKEAEQYINILDEKQIEEILQKYKYGNNKMMDI